MKDVSYVEKKRVTLPNKFSTTCTIYRNITINQKHKSLKTWGVIP